MNIDKYRIITHKTSAIANGAVIYRMSRDQRVNDNWALLFAIDLANKNNAPLAVVFTLVPNYISANFRHFDFMLRGLAEVKDNLRRLNIPLIIIKDNNPSDALASFIVAHSVNVVISDFDPLRHKQQWIEEINKIEGITHYEIDAHNIVPCHHVSPKLEFGAYTIRPKIKKQLSQFLTAFPLPAKIQNPWAYDTPPFSYDKMLDEFSKDAQVKPVSWPIPGEDQAAKMLSSFIANRLNGYSSKRNNPTLSWQSNLSPYLHFGQISAQRVALEIVKSAAENEDVDAFLEELIVRRELSDNFCYYNENYDNSNGFADWAKKDIELHKNDQREYVYSLLQLEGAQTHDALWNAAQNEMVTSGKMHGYMRMYWAKKILEWTPDVETAMKNAIYLNDKYSLDGRDPNGYAGIAWSIGGVHDRAWFPRPVFGKIRYMSYNGCKAKFDIGKYISDHT